MSEQQMTLLDIENIQFPEGLIGIPEWKNFKLHQTMDMIPVALLHSEDEPKVSFIVADPLSWFADYKPDITAEDLALLKAENREELYLLAIVNVESEPFLITANLLSPVIINPKARLGKQLLLHRSPYLARQPLTLKTSAVTLDDGLIGIPEWKNFMLQVVDELLPVKLLVCKDEPRVSFPVVDPWMVDSEYSPEPKDGSKRPGLSDEDTQFIHAQDKADLEWLAILNVESEPFKVTANLMAPIAYNRKTGKARQILLAQSGYQPNFPLKTLDISVEVQKKEK